MVNKMVTKQAEQQYSPHLSRAMKNLPARAGSRQRPPPSPAPLRPPAGAAPSGDGDLILSQ